MTSATRTSILISTVVLLIICVAMPSSFPKISAWLAFLLGPIVLIWLAARILKDPVANVPELSDPDRPGYEDRPETYR